MDTVTEYRLGKWANMHLHVSFLECEMGHPKLELSFLIWGTYLNPRQLGVLNLLCLSNDVSPSDYNFGPTIVDTLQLVWMPFFFPQEK